MTVDNVGDLHAFQERIEEGQGTQIDDFLGANGSMPGEAHGGFSLGEKGDGEAKAAKVCAVEMHLDDRAAVKILNKLKNRHGRAGRRL
jgi:hypothetical protein